MVEQDREERVLLGILERDPRYARGAYEFVRSAVHYASHVVYERGAHVTGRELLEGIREYALDTFGYLARTVFYEWGITSTENIGEIVFNLVNANLLMKNESDTMADFRDGYDFEDAFDRGFADGIPWHCSDLS